MKRVLLGSMPIGGGHHALRDSFLASLQAADPHGRTFEPIVFDSTDTKLSGFYSLVVNHVPWLQGVQFELGRHPWAPRFVTLFAGTLYQEVQQTLLRTKPDVVVSTHFILSMMFSRARRKLGLDVPVISALPDYGETVRIFFPDAPDLRADYLIAMDRTTYRQLLYKEHVEPHRIHLGGFNPRPEFLEVSRLFDGQRQLAPPRRQALLSELQREHPELAGVDLGRPTLIFLGGSAWTEKTMPVLEQLIRNPGLSDRLNLIVVSGKNELFRTALANRVARNPRFSVLGFVSPQVMAKLVALADVPVLGSLAPATLHELLELRCGPLMLFHFIPGNETAHVQYIREQRIGLYQPNPVLMMRALAQVAGLEAPSAEVRDLLASFPNRAQAIRADHAERASTLPTFLANVGGVVPIRAPIAPERAELQVSHHRAG